MRRSNWTPSIVPRDDDQNVYLVADDFGRSGRAYRETDVEATDLETVIVDMLDRQFKNPVAWLGSIPPKMVAGRLCRRCAGSAPALRSAAARRPVFPAGIR
jgi:hypothetical protein